MYTHSNQLITKVRLGIFALLLAISIAGSAQTVTVTATVMPPFGPRLDDYTQKPGKLIVLLQPGPIREGSVNVYLAGKITSMDGEIVINTVPVTKPLVGGIMLTQNSSKILSFNDISSIFDDQNLEYHGISREQVLKQGLPEGWYSFCFTVYKCSDNSLLSTNESLDCSSMFNISAVEAPIIISPQNNTEEIAKVPQFVLFQWAMPAGAPIGVKYTLKIVELNNPGMNPEDAFNSTGYPVFFETEVNNTIYPYTVANPPLAVGKKYAFRVTVFESNTAVNPTTGNNKLNPYFKNNGNSEVYTFTYSNPATEPIVTENQTPQPTNFILSLPYLSGTDHLKGIMTDADIKQLDDYITASKNIRDTINITSENPLQFAWLWSSGDPQKPTIQTTDYKYELSFYKFSTKIVGANTPQTKENTPFYTINISDTIKHSLFSMQDLQKAGFTFNNTYSFVLKTYNSALKEVATINGRELFLTNNLVTNKARVVTGNLSYRFGANGENYSVGYTPVKISLSNTPATYFFATTDRFGNFKFNVNGVMDASTIFNLNIASPYYKQLAAGLKPAIGIDTIMLGNLVTEVFNYSATFQVMEKYKYYSIDSLQSEFSANVDVAESIQKPLPGLDAVLFRKTKASLIPLIEGQLDNKGKFTGTIPKDFNVGNSIPIATAKTTVDINSKGDKITVVKFDKLVCNMQNGDEYFIKVLTNDAVLADLETAEQKVAFVPNSNWKKGTLGEKSSQNSSQQTQYQYKDTVYLVSNQPPKSEIKGRLYYRWPDEANRRPLANTNFEVRLEYDFKTDGEVVTEMPLNKFSITDNQGNSVEAFDNGMVVGTGHTQADGSFIVTVINHNAKGEIGSGNVEPVPVPKVPDEKTKPANKDDIIKGWIEEIYDDYDYGSNLVTNPTYESGYSEMLENDFSSQQMINNNSLGGMAKVAEVKTGLKINSYKGNTVQKQIQGAKKTGGPHMDPFAPEFMNYMDVTPISGKVRRVLRIKILDSKYYYSPNKDIVVQPYDKTDAGDFDAVVAEAKLNIKVTDKITKTSLNGIKALIFRNTADNSILPQGEGNQNGKKNKLLSPTNEQSEYSGTTPAYLNQEFEWVSLDETENGEVTLSRLLSNYKTNGTANYMLEISTSPALNVYFYKIDLSQVVIYNSVGYWNQVKYKSIKWDTRNIELTPLPSRIAGRSMDAVSKLGIDKSLVMLSLNKKSTQGGGGFWDQLNSSINSTNSMPEILLTDKDGYFEFLDKVSEENLAYDISVSKSGYLEEHSSGILQKNGAQRVANYYLQPDAIIFGKITDADNPTVGVPSYIKVDDGKIFETKSNQGNFVIQVPSGTNRIVHIIPQDVGYFNDSIIMDIKKSFATPAINAKVYRRQHRLRFRVMDEQTNKYIKGASITFIHNNSKKITNNDIPSIAEFQFENVSVNAYSVKVEGPAGYSYIPKQINLTNSESKFFTNYLVKLKLGKTLSGMVRLDGVPVKNALVYIDKSAMGSTIANQLPEMTTRTDKNGFFLIVGVPLASECTEVVKATLDTTFTVIGAQVLVQTGNEGNVMLNLKKFRKAKIDRIYDIPFSVEELKPLNSDTSKFSVTGMVHLDKCTSQFGWFDASTSSVRVRDIAMSIKPINNQLTAVPDIDSVEIDATPTIKMQFGKKYNVSVTRKPLMLFDKKANNLLLNKNTSGKGYMNGLVKLVDNSFNFPSTYISFDKYAGDFYFGEATGSTIENNLRVLTMQSTVQNNIVILKTYSVSDSRGKPITFSFLGFEAKANPFTSFISTSGDLSLSINVKCKLPHANPDTFSLQLNGLKIDNNSVQPYIGSNSLKIMLEKWTLEINNWKIDVKEGGITSTSGMVRTGTLDVPFNHFVLRPDLFVFDGFNMATLQLGGGLTLNIDTNVIKPDFVYDSRIGSDQSGHWKFVLLGNDQTPVSVINLPALNYPLRIKSIALLSNGENMVGIIQDNFILHNVCKFKPDVFYAGKSNFMLAGGLDLSGPRLSPIAVNLKFKKPLGQNIIFDGTDPINFEFEGKGYVKFEVKNQLPTITDKKFEIEGTMVEPSKFKPIDSKLIVLGPPTSPPDQRFKVEAKNDFNLILSAGAFNLKLKNALSTKKFNGQPFNGMMVAGNDWDNLQFTGELIEIPKNNAKLSLSNPGKNNVLTFTVYGDMQATSDKVEVSNLSALPGLSLTYLFTEERLVGNLTLAKQPIGGFSVSGAMEFSIGTPGWYMAAAAQVTGIPVVQDISAGFLMGKYSNLPDNVIKIATQFSKTVPCALNDSKLAFSGFFITGQKSMPLIPNVDITLDVGVAAFYVKVDMPSLDVSLYTPFEPFSVYMGIGIYAGVKAGMSSILCTDISGSASVIGRVFGSYNSGNFTIGGDVCGSIGINVTQGVPTLVGPCVGNTSIFSKSLGLKINASISSTGNKDFGFDFSDGCPVKCF